MIRLMLFRALLAALFVLSALPASADRATRALRDEVNRKLDLDGRFTVDDVTLYVRSNGVDGKRDCRLANRPCKTIKHALNRIPNGFTADITVDVGPGTFAWPSYTLPEPGFFNDSGGSTQEGRITVRGACESPLATFTGISPTLVSNRVAQITYNSIPGGWTGSVTDGSHYVILNNRGFATRTSTSPDLVVVRSSTAAQDGTLCAYETVIDNGGDRTTYVHPVGPVGELPRFEQLKFMDRTDIYSIQLRGCSLASSSVPVVSNASLRGVYVATTSNQTWNGRFFNNDENNHSDVLLESCLTLFGQFLFFGGVIKGSCTSQAQMWVGRFSTTSQVYGTHSIRNSTGIDFEGNGDCLRLNNAVMRVGTATTQGITCNPSGTGRFAVLDNGAQLHSISGQTISGTTTAAAQVFNGSFFDTAGSYTVVNSNVGVDGDFTIGATTSVLKAAIPTSDATHFARVY